MGKSAAPTPEETTDPNVLYVRVPRRVHAFLRRCASQTDIPMSTLASVALCDAFQFVHPERARVRAALRKFIRDEAARKEGNA